MRDLTRTSFNSNSPMKNFVRLSEKIEALQTRVRKLEEVTLELMVSKK